MPLGRTTVSSNIWGGAKVKWDFTIIIKGRLSTKANKAIQQSQRKARRNGVRIKQIKRSGPSKSTANTM